jgi:hypothetical protein
MKLTFFSPRRFFVPRENCWGGQNYMGKIYGVTIFTVVTNFNKTLLEVPKLQKTIPRKANYLPHFAEV